MQPGRPDPELVPPPPPSLADRLARGWRARRGQAGGWGAVGRHAAAGVAALIAAGPLLTIAGAQLLTAREHAASAVLREALAPRLAAERAGIEARAILAEAIARPAPGAVIEALAAALPEEATLVRVERTRGGALEVEIASADPDALRTALRRSRALAGLRDSGQRSSDGAIVTTFRETRP